MPPVSNVAVCISAVLFFFLIALDFNSNPISVTIMAGDTSGTATIPITDDSIVERDESFDAVLTTDSRGVIIGTPGQAEVTVNDDEVSYSECLRVVYHTSDLTYVQPLLNYTALTVMFEMPVYNVSEPDEKLEACLVSIGENEIPVAITVQPLEILSIKAKKYTS